MPKCRLSIGLAATLALALAGCGDSASEPVPRETMAAEPDMAPPVMGEERQILAFGDSLFAGYRVEATESYPAALERALRAQGINARIANAGISGDTTAAGLQRLAFTLDNQPEVPELVIVELGGNDLLRGLSPDQTRANLTAILQELKQREIPAMLMGMRAPPNMGSEFQAEFDAIYPALAKEFDVPLVPFFLDGVIDKPDLMQADHVHPTARGIEEIVAATREDVAAALGEGEGK